MELVELHAGEGCSVEASGNVRLRLYRGSVLVCGVELPSDRVVNAFVQPGEPVELCSLEGGCVAVQADGDFLRVRLFPTMMSSCIDFVRRELQPAVAAAATEDSAPPRLCFACAGPDALVAGMTVANMAAARTMDPPILCDLSLRASPLARLGTVSWSETHRDVPLGLGSGWYTMFSAVAFFHGAAASGIANESLAHYHCAVAQLIETVGWVARQRPGAPLVFLLPPPSPAATANQDVLLKALLDAIRPTHILYAGGARKDDGAEGSLTRSHPDARVFVVGALSSASVAGEPQAPQGEQQQQVCCAQTLALDEYFHGTGVNPLGSARITVPRSQIQPCRLEAAGEAGGSSRTAVSAIPVARDGADRSLVGAVCAVSLATRLEEVPFANIAGFVVVIDDSADDDELVLLSPSTEALLPSPFLIVHPGITGASVLAAPGM